LRKTFTAACTTFMAMAGVWFRKPNKMSGSGQFLPALFRQTLAAIDFQFGTALEIHIYKTQIMDKNIEAEVLPRKRKKMLIIAGTIAVVLAASIFLFRFTFASSIKKTAITTAVVEKGDIEQTLDAAGEILPEFEEVITSPINASIQSVLVDEGAPIKAGQSILTLDKSATEQEYERLRFMRASKQNDIHKLKLELDKSFYDLQSNNRIKELEINSLSADVENAKRLFKAGGGTREDIEKAELSLKVAREEKQRLENEIKIRQQTMEVEMKQANLSAAIQQNELDALSRKLKLANITATRDGVVTWVNKNIGTTIREGESLTHIANLNSFKAQGTISDNHLKSLRSGLPALIRVNDTLLRGTITAIQPSIQNGLVSFSIKLDDHNYASLRPNMKVDVYLVTSFKKNILRVANGPAFKGSSTQEIFVMQNGKAVRRTTNIGLTNFDYVELDNVKPGDIVITSDMSKFKNAKEITITD
jgi:HlyD family secretion protein